MKPRRHNHHGITASSGNVFADLKVAAPDTALAKAKLAAEISQILTHRGLTQTQAAEVLGIPQPRVSALVRGQLAGFSTERLLRFLNALGRDIEIVIKKPDGRDTGRLRIVTAR